MPSKRPIKAFYISKKKTKLNGSHNTPSSPVTPSFAVIDEIHSPDPASYSPFGRISQISNFSRPENSWNSSKKASSEDSSLSKNDIEDEENSEEKDYKTWLFIIFGLLIAACLVAVAVLLAVMIANKSKGNIRLISEEK
ncbi:unnamed protein product [Rotaria sp. Silwood2]|nr:unnamed protein product [Rotaria sp. Silwood2]CAF2786822.1 unnamed protein product [Rotaria sp. Silwood2]CAF4209256.1 unnamed protein product [Rotaria sp. Silwood2]CAF4373355.1 unnamed protein product [Rotaria sp. Silwood2]